MQHGRRTNKQTKIKTKLKKGCPSQHLPPPMKSAYCATRLFRYCTW